MRTFTLLSIILAAVGCSASSPSTSDDGTFAGHPPSSHVAVAITCASHADAGATEACTRASECSAGQACLCAGPPSNSGLDVNVCVASTCVTDADCGPHGYCSESRAPRCVSGSAGFFCHTAKDTCSGDTDCSAGSVCTWTGASWSCVSPVCTG